MQVRWAAANALMIIGDPRALQPLIHLLMRGDVVPPGFVQALLGMLRRSIHHLPVETLLDLTCLMSVAGTPPKGDAGHSSSRAADYRLDCSEFRQLAQQELARRGIQP
jgi:HEAT repeat protein